MSGTKLRVYEDVERLEEGKFRKHAGITVIRPEEFQTEATMVAPRDINIS